MEPSGVRAVFVPWFLCQLHQCAQCVKIHHALFHIFIVLYYIVIYYIVIFRETDNPKMNYGFIYFIDPF